MNTVTKQDYIVRNTPKWEQIGQSCRNVRLLEKMSIREVAAELGISKSTVSKFELGKPVLNAKLIEHAYWLLFRAIAAEKKLLNSLF